MRHLSTELLQAISRSDSERKGIEHDMESPGTLLEHYTRRASTRLRKVSDELYSAKAGTSRSGENAGTRDPDQR